mgnify:CR=1 FL=1
MQSIRCSIKKISKLYIENKLEDLDFFYFIHEIEYLRDIYLRYENNDNYCVKYYFDNGILVDNESLENELKKLLKDVKTKIYSG